MIEVKLPIKGQTPDNEIEQIVSIMQSAPELGFVMKATILDAIASNSTRGTIWAVYLDGEPVGAAMIGSRRPYDHVYRTGDVTVRKDLRRRRLGTCLYTATAMQGVLEGRREVEETVIESLSPWMVYNDPKIDGVSGDGFLPSLNYKHYGTLPQRTGGFRDIQLWCHSPFEIDDYLSRLPGEGVIIELQDATHDQLVFERNVKNYRQHDPALADRAVAMKQWLLDGADELVKLVT